MEKVIVQTKARVRTVRDFVSFVCMNYVEWLFESPFIWNILDEQVKLVRACIGQFEQVKDKARVKFEL